MDTLELDQVNLVTFVMIDATGLEVAGLGSGFSVQVSKNGGAFAAGLGTKAEISNGWYRYLLTAGECDTRGPLSIRVTGAGAVQQNIVYTVGGSNSSARAFSYTLTSTVGGTPIAGASVWVTTDVSGVNVIAQATTDAFGVAVFYLDDGDYYFWRAAPGYSFTNPDAETVSA